MARGEALARCRNTFQLKRQSKENFQIYFYRDMAYLICVAFQHVIVYHVISESS